MKRAHRIAPGGLPRAGAVTLILTAASLGLAACGGDDETSTSAATTTTAPSGKAQTVKVSETEFKLAPADPTVKPGEVTFEVSNDGQVTHSLEVEGPSGESQLDSDLQPGDSGELSVDLSQPGTYEFYCPIDDHKEMGMEGEITVQG